MESARREPVQLEFDFGSDYATGEQLPLPLDFGKDMRVKPRLVEEPKKEVKKELKRYETRFGLGDNPTIREQLMKLRMDLPAKGK